MSEDSGQLREQIVSRAASRHEECGANGVELCSFVSESSGATNFSTGLVILKSGASMPYHTHSFSGAITIIAGSARLLIEGRNYRLNPRDSAHIPAGISHAVKVDDSDSELVAHWAFASAQPTMTLVDDEFPSLDLVNPREGDPETVTRYHLGAVYELSDNAFFTDLFARRFGAVGICGGYGRFLPGASLPCHTHAYDESITIVKGTASCLVQGRRYELSNLATAYVPQGLPHRFLNTGKDEMAMIWVYAGDEPDRSIVDNRFCSGEMRWPENVVLNNENVKKELKLT